MSKLLVLAFFTITCAIGTAVTSLPTIESWFHHECPRWGNIDPSRKFYTFAEGKELMGRRVRSADPSSFPNNVGRVVSVDMIEKDKFYVVIYWEVAPDDGRYGLRYYDRDYYENNLIEEFCNFSPLPSNCSFTANDKY